MPSTPPLQVAVKVLTKKRGAQARGKVLRKIAREIDLLTRLQECCNVVQLLTVFEDDEHAYLVCELCRGGDLEKLLMVRCLPSALTWGLSLGFPW